MRIEYNPRKFLLLVPKEMLRGYFDARGILGNLAWDDPTEKYHETVYSGWQALPQRARDSIGADFLDVAGLATKQGVQVITSALARNDPPVLAKKDPPFNRVTMKAHARCPNEALPDLPAVVLSGSPSGRPPASLR